MRKVKVVVIYSTIIVIVILIQLYVSKRDFNYRNDIFNHEFDRTIGHFERVSTGGDTNSPYLTYYYYVGNNRYERDVQIDRKLLNKCFRENFVCKDYRFWIVYSKSDIDKSLIDLSSFFIDTDTSKFPSTLENFK